MWTCVHCPEKLWSTRVQSVHTGVCLHFMLSLAQAFVQSGGHTLHDFIQWHFSLKLLTNRRWQFSFAATVTFPWTEKTKWVKRKQNSDAFRILTQLSCKSFDWDRRNVMKCLSTLPTLSSVHKTAACRDDRSRTDPGSWHLSQSRVSSAQWLLTIVSDLANLQCCFVCDIDESVSDLESLVSGDTKSQNREKEWGHNCSPHCSWDWDTRYLIIQSLVARVKGLLNNNGYLQRVPRVEKVKFRDQTWWQTGVWP